MANRPTADPRSTADAIPGRDEDAASAGVLLRRAVAEFIEMPGLQLTAAQAARFWVLDQAVSERIMEELVAAGFLRRSRTGTYLRQSTP